jgi:ribosomal protein L11 methyltransferase
MDYVELAVDARPEAVEAVADLLRRYAPGGVAIEEPFTAIDEEGRIERHVDEAVTVRAWVRADGAATDAALHRLRDELGALDGSGELRTATVAQESWADAWKQHFPVLRIGSNIVIKPSWQRHRARKTDVVIELDPGMAFGTGQHETTRMCLEALEGRLDPGMRVLDLGCGSGILSIAAARLGAGEVDAVDVLPEAVEVTNENAAANSVANTVRAAQGSLGNAWPFPEPAASRYDLLLANISSRTVRELAGGMIDALGPGGVAIVSGVIEEHEPGCVAALISAGGAIVERRAGGAWRLFVVRRP